MKNIKAILTIIVIGYILSSCNKNEFSQPISINIAESISKDSSFNTIVELELELKTKVEGILLEKNLSSDQLNRLVNKDPELLNYFKEFILVYYKAWRNLNNKYSNIKEKDIMDASKAYFEQRKILAINENKIKSTSIKPNLLNQCSWRFDLCVAGVTAGAILCHAGCIGATAGLGAPACVLLCGTIQVAAGAECMKSYCDFKY